MLRSVEVQKYVYIKSFLTCKKIERKERKCDHQMTNFPGRDISELFAFLINILMYVYKVFMF